MKLPVSQDINLPQPVTHTSPIKSAGDTSAAGRSPEIVPAGQIGAAGQVVIPFMFVPAYNRYIRKNYLKRGGVVPSNYNFRDVKTSNGNISLLEGQVPPFAGESPNSF